MSKYHKLQLSIIICGLLCFVTSCYTGSARRSVASQFDITDSQLSNFETSSLLSDFIADACQLAGQNNLEKMLKEKYSAEFGHALDPFIGAFSKWLKNQKMISDRIQSYRPKWQLNQCYITMPASNQYYKEWEVQKNQTGNSIVSFLPTSHFQGLNEDQIKNKMLFLDNISLQNKILLLEGFEFHEQISCKEILTYALRNKQNLKSSEHTYMLHKAFWTGVPAMGADNQRLEEADFAKMPLGSKKKVGFLHAHRILGRLLLKNNSDFTDFDEYINKAILLAKLDMTIPQYKAYYKKLNHRGLPQNPNQLMMDLAPAEYQNLGTNRLVGILLEPPRNQALLNAIELTSSGLGDSFIVYGAAHFGIVRDDLLLASGSSMPTYCKEFGRGRY
jgi:hypothetical protein